MNTTVFRAYGGTGSHVAAERGHDVRAVYRAAPPGTSSHSPKTPHQACCEQPLAFGLPMPGAG